jgi:hypothetical protein
MSDSEHDDEFEAYLKRGAPMDKRASSLEHLEPPAELDRLVIDKARKAIRGASPVHFYRAPKWALPVALAAIILVSFASMLGLGVRELRRERGTQAAPTTETRVTESTATPNAPAPTAVPPLSTTPWPPAPTVPSASSSAARRAESMESVESDKARTRVTHAEVAAKRSRTDAESAFPNTPGKSRLASLANAPLQSMVVNAQPLADADESVTARPQNASTSMDLTPALASMASSARAALEGIPDPAARLEQIEKLRGDGHAAQAEREMKRFRAIYPDYPTPAGSSRP